MLKKIYKTNFKLDNLKEEKESFSKSSSEITFEDNEYDSMSDISVNSEEMEPELKSDFDDDKINKEIYNKEVFIFSLVKLKNKIVEFKEDNKNLNVLSFFKNDKNERILNFDNEDYNYSFYCDLERFLKNKIYHYVENDFLKRIDEVENKKEGDNKMEIEKDEKNEISIIIQDEDENKISEDFTNKRKILPNYYSLQKENDKKKYSVNLKNKYLEIKNFKNDDEKIEERNILKIKFEKEKNFFKGKIEGGFYGSFFNLDKKKFKDRLILENGILFMVNNKRGFYISNINGKDEFEKKNMILKKNFKNIEFCPTNFNYNKKEEFYKYLLNYYGEGNSGDFDKKKFKKYFNLFCYENFEKNKIPFICFDFVEFFKDYKLYRTKIKCILFQINFQSNQNFFKSQSENYQFSFGNEKYNLLKDLDLNYLNPIFSFNTPYNLKIGFLSSLEKYYFEYKKEKEEISNSYCNFFSRNEKDCIKFKEKNENSEGIWICLSKFNIFQNEFFSENEVLLPFDCYVMNFRNVFKISKDFLGIN